MAAETATATATTTTTTLSKARLLFYIKKWLCINDCCQMLSASCNWIVTSKRIIELQNKFCALSALEQAAGTR